MAHDEDNDIFQQMTFKEKVKDNISDVFYFGLTILAFAFAAYGNKNIKSDTNQTETVVNKVQIEKQSNTAMYNDSINQHVR